MPIELISYKEDNPRKFQFKFCKRETRGSSYFIPLKIKKDQVILLKTPKLYMPFQPKFQTSESGYLRLSFDNYKIDSDVQAFYSFFKNLENHLHNSLPTEFKRKEFRSAIKQSPPWADYFNVNFETNQLKVYNLSLEPISLKDIQGKFYAYFIVQLSGIYYNPGSNLIGTVWDLIQFKLDNPKNAIQECLFLDEIQENKPKELLKDHAIIKSYTKMLNLGVPKNAVAQRMRLKGDDPEFLEYLDYDVSELPEKLKKIINLADEDQVNANINNNIDNIDNNNSNNNNNSDNGNNSDNLNNDGESPIKGPPPFGLALINPNLLKGGLNKLKKVDEDPRLAKIKKRSGYIYPVPSLDQIKDALSNLKSLNESDKKGDY